MCAPDCRFLESLERLALSEHMEIAAGTELCQEAEPLRRIDAREERWQERMVQHFQYLHLRLSAAFLAPTRELTLVHDLGRERREVVGGGWEALELGEVDRADVAGAKAVDEPEVC